MLKNEGEKFESFFDRCNRGIDGHSSTEESQSGIPFMGGRPERDLTITTDEIIDLKILLETTSSVNEFERAIA